MPRDNKKVIQYRKPISFNIGVVIFLLLSTYLAIISYRYFTKGHVTIYEVTEKRIADDNRITGFILRNERIVYSEQSGNINYFTNEGKRVAKNEVVYTIDNTGGITEYLSNLEEKEGVGVNKDAIRKNISQYKSTFDFSNYGKLYDLKYDLENAILESATNADILADLQEVMRQNGETGTFEVVKTQQSGILSYTIDGMEGMSLNDLTLELFEQPEVKRTQLRSLTTIEAGSPAYKLIPDEDWSIIVPLTYEQLEKLKDKSNVNVKICKDGLSTNVNLSIMEVGEKPFAKLDLKKYMIRYLTDRFIDIELIINSAEGLKIPTNSIFEKECFLVEPKYLEPGGNSNQNGIIKEVVNEEGETDFVFVDVNVIMEDEEYLYIDSASLAKGDWIRNSSQERMQLVETSKVEGVYNVNEGYSKFRRVEKVYKNPEYCIIKRDTKYGLSVYDHIVVNPKSLGDEDLIY